MIRPLTVDSSCVHVGAAVKVGGASFWLESTACICCIESEDREGSVEAAEMREVVSVVCVPRRESSMLSDLPRSPRQADYAGMAIDEEGIQSGVLGQRGRYTPLMERVVGCWMGCCFGKGTVRSVCVAFRFQMGFGPGGLGVEWRHRKQ